jgi:hypothetical protein
MFKWFSIFCTCFDRRDSEAPAAATPNQRALSDRERGKTNAAGI